MDKNATPSDGPRAPVDCLDEIRPKAFTLDRQTSSCTDPAAIHTGALNRYGELHVQTGNEFIDQWHPKYLSQVFPLVIPRMVSGPDYDFQNRWMKRPLAQKGVTIRKYILRMYNLCFLGSSVTCTNAQRKVTNLSNLAEASVARRNAKLISQRTRR